MSVYYHKTLEDELNEVSGVAELGFSDHRLVCAVPNKDVKHHEARTITYRSTMHLNVEGLKADIRDITWSEIQVAPARDLYLQWKERSISREEVLDALRGINPHKATGFDGLSLRMLQLIANEIAEPLTVITDKVIQESEWPIEWKRGEWVPVYKKEDPNYRPLTLLPTVDRIFEQLFCYQLRDKFETIFDNSMSAYPKRISFKETFLTPNSNMERIKPPSELDIDSLNLADMWKEWKEAWELYWILSGLYEKDDAIQIATIQSILETKARRVLKTLPNIPKDITQRTVGGILTALEMYCVPRKNTTYKRYFFRMTTQEERSFDIFVTDLRRRAEYCDFGAIKDSLMRDQIVNGTEERGVRHVEIEEHEGNELLEGLYMEEIQDEFQDVFKGLGCVEGEYNIKLKANSNPTIQPQRNIPLRLKDKLKGTVKDLEQKDIIAKVEEPVTWVSNLVIVEKPNKTLTLRLDPPDLTEAIKKEDFKSLSFETVSSTLSGCKVFSVADMSNCYWHQKLTEESSFLCVFNSPFGRFPFKRMPFGFSCASEVAQKMVENHFGDISGALPVFDDIIIGGRDEQEHDMILGKVLTRVRERNIKFNRDKIQFRVNKIKYMGEVVSGLVSELGFSPDPDKISAIHNMPTPSCKQDLQRLLGMMNYLAKYIPNMSELTDPLRSLLKSDVPWTWFLEHDTALTKLKSVLSSTPVLRFYDTSLPTTLEVDAGKNGLGACLMQQNQPVAYASRAMSISEISYAQIEKELLAIVYGCERFNMYTYGAEIEVLSDHKPLESIFKQPLFKVPSRLQRMILRLQRYNLKGRYFLGKFLYIADTLSRAIDQSSVPKYKEAKYKEFYDRQGSKQLPQLKEGDSVRFKKPGDKHLSRAIVTGKHDTPRSYMITGETGREYRRNRRHINLTQEPLVTILDNDLIDDSQPVTM
ncbi:Retrovirus-related Pol polyprotein from transposon 17.6 [Stylophora pistillata]|uniref:Retrovirus-related Pol polyprotein from transposon 17.6 n=1 Tax=Stylophora pistillata TaxID=50429 RepID=A0A2B4RCN2_STYPI|nr:Retrovirus-related Pol polyprotein from transposon 17.6 [Stylophora pistillata]